MKNIGYILLLLFIVSCKNDSKEIENADIEVNEIAMELEVNPSSLERLPIQKLKEYIELIQLKQQHPEFKSDIDAQLLSFTNDKATIFNYEDGFTISEIQHMGNTKIVSDSIETFTLTFKVTANSKIFRDSVITRVTSHSDYLLPFKAVALKKVTFSKSKK